MERRMGRGGKFCNTDHLVRFKFDTKDGFLQNRTSITEIKGVLYLPN